MKHHLSKFSVGRDLALLFKRTMRGNAMMKSTGKLNGLGVCAICVVYLHYSRSKGNHYGKDSIFSAMMDLLIWITGSNALFNNIYILDDLDNKIAKQPSDPIEMKREIVILHSKNS
jgi:hypothetical protein